MTFPSLKIGDLTAKIPIIQGGMGVGISLSGLAAAVANQGAIGVIAGAFIGMDEKDVVQNPEEANNRALRREIRAAREMAPNGILGVNLMVALTHFASMVRSAIEERIDLILSGAGIPLDLPRYLREVSEKAQEEMHTKLVPIVSSARAATIICRKWLSRFGCLPDAFVVEGPLAGGHLGFKHEELASGEKRLEALIPPVVEAVKAFEDKKGCPIPVIAAGGIGTGAEIARFLRLGASGVQMGTRFIGTHECDADIRFKQAVVDASPEDVTIITSPVGMPGRALGNAFLEEVAAGRKKPFKCLFHCIHGCKVEESPYCIALALLNAKKGNLDRGFVFTGARVELVREIVSVRELFAELEREYAAAEAAMSA